MIRSSATLLVAVLSVRLVQSETCGRRTASILELVSHGSGSRLGEWPWHAAVLHGVDGSFPSYACGGTILSRSYVVTAAHCTYTQYKVRALTVGEIVVYVGITNIQKLQPTLAKMSVARIDRHDEYNTRTSENDIALLQLSSELEFTDYVKPVCLWMGGDGEGEIVGKEGYVAGWGRDENSRLPDVLKHVVMPIVSRKVCRARDELFYTRYLFDRSAFCAGYGNGSSANSGDSGSGLHIEIEGQWQLRGIVSKGRLNPTSRQVDTSSYIVFTDVAYFRTWIQAKMGVGSLNAQESDDYAVCGRKEQPKFRRTGSKEERKWPWQGEVYRYAVRLCEAVIISEFFLLSPADVYNGKDVSDPVNLRAVFKNGTGHVLADYPILRILRHENFTRDTRTDNVALLELAGKVTFTRLLRPICLWSVEFNVAGIDGHIGEYIENLISFDQCGSDDDYSELMEGAFCYYRNSYIIPSDFVYIRQNGTWYLRGVIFNVVPVTISYYPTFYYMAMLDVSRYKDWIRNQQQQSHSVQETQHNLLAQICEVRALEFTAYMVHVSDWFKCFATIIARSLLITTGSCVDGLPVESIFVSRGTLGQHVRKVHLHPHFDNRRLVNNIALIELSAPMAGTLLCLPTFSESLSRLQPLMPTGQVNMSPFQLTIANAETCAQRWRAEGVQLATDGSQFCANLAEDRIETLKKYDTKVCESQLEGMPVVYTVNDTYFVRGVLDVSVANHCDHNGLSEVFVDVMFYASWIREVFSKCGFCPTYADSDDEDKELIKEWRNLDPANRTG